MSKWLISAKRIIIENPVIVMMIGLCPALAVTNTVRSSLGIGIATSFVLILANTILSLTKKIMPDKIRIHISIIIIATVVTIVDYFMQAFYPDLRQTLGIFVPLIVVNCIILSRVEAFTIRNSVVDVVLDGLAAGIGFTLMLAVIGAIREILGHGTFLGNPIFGGDFKRFPITFMILPPGAFLAVGILMGLFNKYIKKPK